ncbi:hypothetical protein NL676_019891 [Syzygium grande]|nr:hypothetical protein NL676_019891 [Syzygium grande]
MRRRFETLRPGRGATCRARRRAVGFFLLPEVEVSGNNSPCHIIVRVPPNRTGPHPLLLTRKYDRFTSQTGATSADLTGYEIPRPQICIYVIFVLHADPTSFVWIRL